MSGLKFDLANNELDLFNSMYSNFLPTDNEISIRWANIGVYEHELNRQGLENILYIDRCRIHLKDIELIVKNSQIFYRSPFPNQGDYKSVLLEGADIKDRTFNSFQIFCKSATLILPADYRLNSVYWMTNTDFMQNQLIPFLSNG